MSFFICSVARLDVSFVLSTFMYVMIYILSSVNVAEWPPFGNKLLPRLTICSLFIMSVCCLGYFPFWREDGILVIGYFFTFNIYYGKILI